MKFIKISKVNGTQMVNIDTQAKKKMENQTKGYFFQGTDKNWLLDDLTPTLKSSKNGKTVN